MAYLFSMIGRSSLGLIVFGLLTTFSWAQSFFPTTEARLQSVLEEFQNNPDNPFVGGMAAAVHVDGVTQWVGTTGYAARNVNEQNELLPGGTPFLPETPSRLYSVTKTFTAALVLELVAEGVIGLDDPVSKYVSINAVNSQLSDQVTVHQLLAHESGFSDYTRERDFRLTVATQPERFWQPFELLPFVQKLSEPGELRDYSSTNYLLLGVIMEKATGVPAAELYRQRFFEPIDLSSMYLAGQEEPINPDALAAPHDNISAFNPIFQSTGRPTFPDYDTNISAFPFTGIISAAFTTGALVGNIYDLVTLGAALYNGRLISDEALSLMLNSIGGEPEPDGDVLGYGLWTNDKISETDYLIGHTGASTGYRSLLFHQPDQQITIAILSNYAGADNLLYPVATKLLEALDEVYCESEPENVQLCWGGEAFCVPKSSVAYLTRMGAVVGECAPPQVEKFTLLDAKTSRPLQEIKNGDIIDIARLAKNEVVIVAETYPKIVGRVEFQLEGPSSVSRTEYFPPYALFGDFRNYYRGQQLPPGDYQLSAKPYSIFRNSVGETHRIDFTVIDSRNTAAERASSTLSLKSVFEELTVYPVPTRGMVNLRYQGPDHASYLLSDAEGRILQQGAFSDLDNAQLDLRDYRSGLYYLRIITATAIMQQKIVLK